MPPGSSPHSLVDVGFVLVDAADTLAKAGQGVLQRGASSFVMIWLGRVRGLALANGRGVAGPDGGHTDGEGDEGEEGPHDDDDDELLCLKQN